jgi:2,3-bisphosphoglycerate-dependent phosphoglycerate mutase
MRLLLIRHGESANNRLQVDTGSGAGRVPDPDLTELGARQADRLAAAFASGRLPRPRVLLASPMRRAVATAGAVGAALDLPVTVDTDLFEVNGVYLGEYRGHQTVGTPHPGSPASALRLLSPRLELPADVDESGWYRRPFETPVDAWARAVAVVADLRRRADGTDDLVAVVCHEWIIQYLLRALCDWPPEPDGSLPIWFEVNNTGHVLVGPGAAPDNRMIVRWVNRLDHLAADEITT